MVQVVGELALGERDALGLGEGEHGECAELPRTEIFTGGDGQPDETLVTPHGSNATPGGGTGTTWQRATLVQWQLDHAIRPGPA
ncbi:hypothetical protein ACODT5_00140 [Streptomyces sp. 5.8]|uniref:hypothetical protein n=1 Tax=Streptomyces sp. 5.8 TaxID=3406571 RepID=UPI003BB80A5D